jgi:hypothetical protein
MIFYKNIFDGVIFQMIDDSGETVEILKWECKKSLSPDDLLEVLQKVLVILKGKVQ